jgi:hypothetical protein
MTMTQVPETPDGPPRDTPNEPSVPDDERDPAERDEERAPGDDPGHGPSMEAPGAVTGTAMDAASWNPAKGDRSFGYGAGITSARTAARSTVTPSREDEEGRA